MRVLRAAVLAVACLGAGFLLGLPAGAFNARIDFGDDDSSSRFIADETAREASCRDP